MPDNNKKTKPGLKEASSSYQKGGSKFQEGTVGGKVYEGTRYIPDKPKKKEVVEIDNIMDGTDPSKEYKIKGRPASERKSESYPKVADISMDTHGADYLKKLHDHTTGAGSE